MLPKRCDLQADRGAFLDHALKVLLWLPSYATRARVDPGVSAGQRWQAEQMNDHARLLVCARSILALTQSQCNSHHSTCDWPRTTEKYMCFTAEACLRVNEVPASRLLVLRSRHRGEVSTSTAALA